MQNATRITRTIREIVLNYHDDNEEGVWAFDDKLEVRPAYQREFVYNEKQQSAVIDTIMADMPLGVFHWNKIGNRFQVIDGQQRTLSICKYIQDEFAWNGKYYKQLSPSQRQQINNYELDIYIYEFETKSDVVQWFRVINTAGKPLNDQEILNSCYTGPWLTDAKLYFSKGNSINNSAAMESKGYIKAVVETQGYLTEALSYIADKNNQTIEEYMQAHHEDENANALKNYFKSILRWARRIYSPMSGLTDCVDWGRLYELYKDNDLEDIQDEINKYIRDEEVSKHTDLIEYVLGGCVDTKLLHLRVFDKKMMDKKYIEQRGVCPICNKRYDRKDMAGDHKIPWARGGKTVYNNLQMLCKTCNAKKSDCAPVEEEEE